jgi:hypothetical protein
MLRSFSVIKLTPLPTSCDVTRICENKALCSLVEQLNLENMLTIFVLENCIIGLQQIATVPVDNW